MKVFLSLVTLLFSIQVFAQGHETGGGQLDITKKNRKVNFKEVENVFYKNLKENWGRCGFAKEKKVPDTFISFYNEFKNEKNTIAPADLVDPAKAVCPDCLQQKIEGKAGGNFLCLIHNVELQKVMKVLITYSKQASTYISKKPEGKTVKSSELIDYFDKFLIDY